MRKKRTYTELEKAQIIDEAKATGNIAALAKKNSIPPATIHTWIKPKYTKKQKPPTASSNELKALKTKLNDVELDNQILKELLKKTYQVWDTGSK
jgi:transposase-like protein